MIITLKTVKQSRIPNVLNLCADDPRLLSFLNEAQERLLSYKEAWLGTWQRARFQITESCIVWPRGVEDIRLAQICGTPMVLRNEWYEYLGPVGEPNESSITGNFLTMKSTGTTPIPKNIQVTGSVIRTYPGDLVDVGKRVLYQGYDENGEWVRTVDTENGDIVVDGEYVTVASPFVDTTKKWARGGITGVQRDATSYAQKVFEVYENTAYAESMMADYQADDTLPNFRSTEIVNYRTVRSLVPKDSTCNIVMDCIVKRSHIPVSIDSDYFVIQSIPALKDAARSVKLEEDVGVGAGEALMGSAIKILRNQLANFIGDTVRIQPDLHGGRTFSYFMRGFR